MTQELQQQLHERVIKSFIDLIILKELQVRKTIDGYAVLKMIQAKHHFMLSSGTVYTHLYEMERKGLIGGEWLERKRIYRSTYQGTQLAKAAEQDEMIRHLLDIIAA